MRFAAPSVTIMSDSPHLDEPCQILPWDSDFFGIRVAKVCGDRLTADFCQHINSWCRREEVDCLYFLGRSDDPALAPLAQAHEFALVDVRTILERQAVEAAPSDVQHRAVSGDAGASPEPIAEIRPATPLDLPALQAIAQVSHRSSRFYFDSRFPRERCDELYRRWIANSCESFTDTVLVADRASVPIGYVTCTMVSESAGRIGLVAVDAAARGAGLGRVLMEEAVRWFAKRGRSVVTVTTQARNIGAQRLYQACGFRTTEVGLYYHRWFVDDKS
jgi:dTDP-4-amino-4,6-dideoxy-D-galactose acyltransferase